MKKLLFIFFISFCSILQAQDYTVSAFNEPYQDLVNATSVNNGEIWDDPFYTISIGFDFELYDQTFNTIYITDIGNGGALSFHSNPQTNYSFLSPIMQDITDKGINQSVSPISYVVVGEAGNRIFKLEYKNVGFWGDFTMADYMDFQVWLYESDNSIEYRYGPNSINSPDISYDDETGPVVFFYPSFDIINSGSFIENGYYLKDDPVNPTVIVADDNTPEPQNPIVGTIPEGTVYRFYPEYLSVSNHTKLAIKAYPNPTQNVINIQNPNEENYTVSLYDILGNKLKIEIHGNQIDLSSFATGTYFLKIRTHSANKTIKVLKK